MASTLVARPTLPAGGGQVDPSGAAAGSRQGWPVHWPLTVTLLGFPLWWALGLSVVIPIAATLVMADQLMRRRPLIWPTGSRWWLLFLIWVALGVFVLFADAPGAVPGGGPGRLLVFAYRSSWYLACTIVMLWVANLKESELPSRLLYQLFGYMFVVTSVGGLVGVLLPNFEFTSPLEMVLPGGLRSNSLVQSIAHPAVADIQHVLGRPQARPRAPFAYANSWGSNFSLFLPFFLLAWIRDGRRWQRAAAPLVLAVASVPAVFSLNRGLWATLALGMVGLLVLLALRGSRKALVATVLAGVLATVVFLASPLSAMLQERLSNPHSNDRRGDLAALTFSSARDGSPIVGFGSTRDVQGSFASIAGASTPDCEACGVPPMGTQGHFWGLVFGQGLVGAALFIGFLLIALSRSWRCRSTAETLCTFLIAFMLFQISIYDPLGLPLMTLLMTVGLMTREQYALSPAGRRDLARTPVRWVRRAVPVLLVGGLLGGLVGAVMSKDRPATQVARASILLAPSPVYLDTAAEERINDPELLGSLADEVTIDTEAALTVSRQSLQRVLGTSDPGRIRDFRQDIRVTAPPNTSILLIEVRSTDPETVRERIVALADSYLVTRREYLRERRDAAVRVLRAKLIEIASQTGSARARQLAPLRRELQKLLTEIVLTSTEAGEVIRVSEPSRERRQLEVPIVSGAALGIGTGAVLLGAFPSWRASGPSGLRPRRLRWRRR